MLQGFFILCMSAGLFFSLWADRQYPEGVGYEFALVCKGYDSLLVAKTRENMAIIYDQQCHYDQASMVATATRS